MLICAIGVVTLIQSFCVFLINGFNCGMQMMHVLPLVDLLEWFSLLCSQNLLLVMFHNHLSALWSCMSASQLDKARHVFGGLGAGCYWS